MKDFYDSFSKKIQKRIDNIDKQIDQINVNIQHKHSINVAEQSKLNVLNAVKNSLLGVKVDLKNDYKKFFKETNTKSDNKVENSTTTQKPTTPSRKRTTTTTTKKENQTEEETK